MRRSMWTCGTLALAVGCAHAPVRTAAPVAAPSPVVTRIVAGSCNDQDEPQGFWEPLLGLAPDLYLALGDNIYADVVVDEGGVRFVEDIGRIEAAYAALSEVEGFRRLRSTVPVMATWDDHDYGLNDAGAELSIREASEAAFLDFWEVPAADPRRARPGIYTAEVFGPPGQRVQVVLLDTRSFRSPWEPTDAWGAPLKERYVPVSDPGRTMLGAAQWAWLEEVLAEPAEVRLVVSSIQVLAEGHGYERWGLFPRERDRLVQAVQQASGTSVLLTGDRHFGALYRLEGRTAEEAPLWELSTSSLNRSFGGGDEPAPRRVGPFVSEENAGMVEVDWEEGVLRLSLVRVDPEGAGQVVSGGEVSLAGGVGEGPSTGGRTVDQEEPSAR